MSLLWLMFACGTDKTSDTSGTGIADSGDTGVSEEGPTFYQDIAPILHQNCNQCHQDGGLNSDLLFDDPETAQLLAPVIANAVMSGSMPPFYAVEGPECENPWGFLHDTRLEADELDLISSWAESGGLIGDPDNPAPLGDRPNSSLVDPDSTLFPAGAYTTSPVGAVKDEFICFSIDPNLTEDHWLSAIQTLPDDNEVVHHVLIGIDNTGQSASLADENGVYPCFGGFGTTETALIGGWVPGAAPLIMPQHSAVKVPVGSRIVLQMHYHLIEEARSDRTGLQSSGQPICLFVNPALDFLENSPFMLEDGSGLQPGPNDPQTGPEFKIPADSPDHTETMRLDVFGGLQHQLEVYMVANHMHYIGRDMRVWLEKGDQTESCLLHTPSWDFDWQQFYFYDVNSGNNPKIDPGDELWLSCEFNNTMDNPWAVAALAENGLTEPIDITLGEGSLNEMCLAVMATVPAMDLYQPDYTHLGALNLAITSTHFGIDEQCNGPASFLVDEQNIDGVAACGLDLGYGLASLQFIFAGEIVNDHISGSVKVTLYNIGEYSATWSGTVQGDSIVAEINLSELIAGGLVNFTGDAQTLLVDEQ